MDIEMETIITEEDRYDETRKEGVSEVTQVTEISETIEEDIIITNTELESNESTNELASATNEEVNTSEKTADTGSGESKSKRTPIERTRLVELPLSKVKSIMKMDPDCHLVSKDALFLTAKATELFLQAVGRETLRYTQMGKRKMIVKRDLDNAINNVSSLCFLDGTLEQLCTQFA